MSELEEYIRARLTERLHDRIATEPWWCSLCGQTGNGGQPGDCDPLLPEMHDCPPLRPDLRGIHP